jgi:CubicO group peptidase (beta-lactamase class C family)
MKQLLTAFLVLVIHSLTNGQALNSQAIDSLTMRSMKTFDVPGIAVAVIKDGKIIHSKGYGVRSLNSKLQVDEQTLFGIASNS